MVIPLTMDSDDDTCPITVTNHDVQINELLCFVICKSRVMSILQISKLCCDFYANSAIQEAKDVLLGSISMPETDKRISRRKTRIAETTMQDIITIFYEMKPRMTPTFVAKDLNNLPPLSMNNFDMAHNIEEMSGVQLGPRYEGQLNPMAEPIPHEVRPLIRTHVYHPYHAADRRAETDS